MVAERLRDATVEGRIVPDELDQRLGAALSARTYGELAPLVSDLPGARVAPPGEARTSLHAAAALALTMLLAGLGVLAWHRL
jgi:hypothetical protein